MSILDELDAQAFDAPVPEALFGPHVVKVVRLDKIKLILSEDQAKANKHAELLARELRVFYHEKNDLERERDEWRRRAESLAKSSGLDAAQERIEQLLDDKDHLLDAIDKDATGLARALGAIKQAIDRRAWVSESRGAYSWDDDKYKEETYEAFKAVREILEPALRKSGTIANEAWRSFEGGRILELRAMVTKLRVALAELGPRPTHLAWCDRNVTDPHCEVVCTCGHDEHNAKVSAAIALAVQP